MRPIFLSAFLLITVLAYVQAQNQQDNRQFSIAPGTALFELLRGNSGWSDNSAADEITEEMEELSSRTSHNAHGLISVNIQLVKLIQALVKLKGDIFGRINDAIVHNAETIGAFIKLLIHGIRSIHNFSLVGLSALIKILEFAADSFHTLGDHHRLH